MTDHQKSAIGPQIRLSMAYSRLSKLDIFGDLKTIMFLQDMNISSEQMKTEHEFELLYSHFCGTLVVAPANKTYLVLIRSYYSVIRSWELVCTAYKSL